MHGRSTGGRRLTIATEGNAVNLKTYQAYSMAEALAAVKRDLGANAVILNTRTFKRGGFLGLGRRTVMEVTATAAGQAEARPKTEALRRRIGTGRVAHEAYSKSARNNPIINAATEAAEAAGPTEDDKTRTRRLAQAMMEKHNRQQASPPLDANPSPAKNNPAADPPTAEAPSRKQRTPPASPQAAVGDSTSGGVGGAPQHSVARRFVLMPPDGDKTSTNGATPSVDSQGKAASQLQRASRSRRSVSLFPDEEAPAGQGASGDVTPGMQEELSAIKQMVGEVLQRQATGQRQSVPAMPQQLFDMYLKLLAQDLSEELADQIVADVRSELTTSDLEDPDLLRDAVKQRLADYIPVASEPVPSCSPDGRPLTIALVGPTGVGKTTTLAKLAASFKLRHNRRVGLITSDTYRIAAVDQLRTYANIIGLPLQVVLTPGEMHRALDALSDREVILIDTAGRSQNDQGRLEELQQFMAAAEPHEVHLVLSGTAGEKVLQRETEAFAEVGVDKIVLTKLDEAVSFGVLVNVIRRVGKDLSFFTTGQEVPDHIELGRAGRLADLILGGEVHE